MGFEDHLNRLESIVQRLDGDALSLDQALVLFEEGIELLRRASVELGAADGKVRLLVEQADGILDTQAFDG